MFRCATPQYEQQAINLEDIDKNLVRIDDVKKVKKWNWVKDGKVISGSREFANVYYGNSDQKMVIVLQDVKSYKGIQQSVKYNSAFISFKLTPEQSALLKEKLDQVIMKLIFDKRQAFLGSKGSKMNHVSEMSLIFQGVVKEGEPKQDDPSVCWPDQLTCTVPTKRKGQDIEVDLKQCQIEDLDCRPYSWMDVDGSTGIKEVAFQIDEIKFGKEVNVKTSARLIVPDIMSTPKIVTKRKLEQRQVKKEEIEESNSTEEKKDGSKSEVKQEDKKVLEPPTKKQRPLPKA